MKEQGVSPGGRIEDRIVGLFKNDRLFLALLALALFFPIFFHGPRFNRPYVKGGDEPHYLVMLNSLLKDGDWDLTNNYENVWNGGTDAGKKCAGEPIDPHALYLYEGHIHPWTEVLADPITLVRNDKFVRLPVTRPGVDYSKLKALPLHPYGLPVLLAAFVWPFKNTPYVEVFSILVVNFFVIGSIFFFRELIGRYTSKNWAVNGATFLVYLATPIWAYGRMLFGEPFLIFFALAAYWAVLKKDSGLWAGIFLGLGMFVKPPLCMLLFPVGLFWLVRKDWGNILRLALGPALVLAYYLYTNNQLFGSPFFFSQHYTPGNVLVGALGLWFYWKQGILVFMPIVVFSLFYWKRFIREKGQEAWLWLGGFLFYFLFMANLPHWYAGWSFGPREIVPILSFVMIPIFYAVEALPNYKKWLRLVFIVLVLFSLFVNFLGALDGYWDNHPLSIFWGEFA